MSEETKKPRKPRSEAPLVIMAVSEGGLTDMDHPVFKNTGEARKWLRSGNGQEGQSYAIVRKIATLSLKTITKTSTKLV